MTRTNPFCDACSSEVGVDELEEGEGLCATCLLTEEPAGALVLVDAGQDPEDFRAELRDGPP